MNTNCYSNNQQEDNKYNLSENRFSFRSTYDSINNEKNASDKPGFTFNESSTIEAYEAYLLRKFQSRMENTKNLDQVEYKMDNDFETSRSISDLITNDYIYYGQLEYGMRHGFGICKFSNGNKYVGKWKRDRMHGIGKLETHQGVYQGDFKQNKPNGYMEFISSEGIIYQGYMNGFVFIENEPLIVKSSTFLIEMVVEESHQPTRLNKVEDDLESIHESDDSMPASPNYSELNCKMTIDDMDYNNLRGSTRDFTHFEEEIESENYEFPRVIGIGNVTYENGNVYCGYLKDNNQDGLGIFKKGSMAFQGYKDNDHYNGLCEVFYNDGTKFCGNLVDNKRHGFAIFYKDFIINICRFHDGVKDGPSITYKYNEKGEQEEILLDIFSLGWRTKQISKSENILNHLELYSPQFLPILNIDCKFLIGIMREMQLGI